MSDTILSDKSCLRPLSVTSSQCRLRKTHEHSQNVLSWEGRGEPSGLTMIPMTSFVEKSNQASRGFSCQTQLTPLHPGPPGRGVPFCF